MEAYIIISNINEYIKLAVSDTLEDNNRTSSEVLSSDLIYEVIQNHSKMKPWLAHNKLPLDLLAKMLNDSEPEISNEALNILKKRNR